MEAREQRTGIIRQILVDFLQGRYEQTPTLDELVEYVRLKYAQLASEKEKKRGEVRFSWIFRELDCLRKDKNLLPEFVNVVDSLWSQGHDKDKEKFECRRRHHE